MEEKPNGGRKRRKISDGERQGVMEAEDKSKKVKKEKKIQENENVRDRDRTEGSLYIRLGREERAEGARERNE